MTKQATFTFKSGASATVEVSTIKLNSFVKATISYRGKSVTASGPNEPAAIKAAHAKASQSWN